MTDRQLLSERQIPPTQPPRWFSVLLTVIFVLVVAGLVAALQTLLFAVPMLSTGPPLGRPAWNHHDQLPDWRTT